jgi:hypothetical protein
VWTPEVVLTHHRRASRGSEFWSSDHERFRQRWEPLLRSGDPFFNPNLRISPELEIADAPPDVEQLRRSLERWPGRRPHAGRASVGAGAELRELPFDFLERPSATFFTSVPPVSNRLHRPARSQGERTRREDRRLKF